MSEFKVGEIICINSDESTETRWEIKLAEKMIAEFLFVVKDFQDKVVIVNLVGGKMELPILLNRVRHATPEEIKAGRRLP